MKKFKYDAMDHTGASSSGVVTAADRNDAVAQVRAMGLFVVSITEVPGGTGGGLGSALRAAAGAAKTFFGSPQRQSGPGLGAAFASSFAAASGMGHGGLQGALHGLLGGGHGLGGGGSLKGLLGGLSGLAAILGDGKHPGLQALAGLAGSTGRSGGILSTLGSAASGLAGRLSGLSIDPNAAKAALGDRLHVGLRLAASAGIPAVRSIIDSAGFGKVFGRDLQDGARKGLKDVSDELSTPGGRRAMREQATLTAERIVDGLAKFLSGPQTSRGWLAKAIAYGGTLAGTGVRMGALGGGVYGGITGLALASHGYAQRQVEEMRGFGPWAPRTFGATVGLDVGRMLRTQRIGSMTDATGVRLVQAMDRAEEAFVPFRAARINIQNRVGTLLAGFSQGAIGIPAALLGAVDRGMGAAGARGFDARSAGFALGDAAWAGGLGWRAYAAMAGGGSALFPALAAGYGIYKAERAITQGETLGGRPVEGFFANAIVWARHGAGGRIWSSRAAYDQESRILSEDLDRKYEKDDPAKAYQVPLYNALLHAARFGGQGPAWFHGGHGKIDQHIK
jgi:hypothetical protein